MTPAHPPVASTVEDAEHLTHTAGRLLITEQALNAHSDIRRRCLRSIVDATTPATP